MFDPKTSGNIPKPLEKKQQWTLNGPVTGDRPGAHATLGSGPWEIHFPQRPLGNKKPEMCVPKKKPLRQTNGFLNLEWDVDGFPCDFRMPWDFHWMLQFSEAPNTRHGAGQADEHPSKKQRLGILQVIRGIPRNHVCLEGLFHTYGTWLDIIAPIPRVLLEDTPHQYGSQDINSWYLCFQTFSDKAAEQTHWNRPINSFQ